MTRKLDEKKKKRTQSLSWLIKANETLAASVHTSHVQGLSDPIYGSKNASVKNAVGDSKLIPLSAPDGFAASESFGVCRSVNS